MPIQQYQQASLLIALATSCSTYTALQHTIQRTMRPATLSSLRKTMPAQPQHTVCSLSTCRTILDEPTNPLASLQSAFMKKQLPEGTEKHLFACSKKGAIAGCLMGIPAGACLGFTEALQYKDTPHAPSSPGGFFVDLTVQTIMHAVACGWVGSLSVALGGAMIGVTTLPLLHFAHKNRLLLQKKNKPIQIAQNKADYASINKDIQNHS